MSTARKSPATRACVALAACALLVTAAAAQDKPAIFADTKAVDIAVTIDAVLKSSPGLYESVLAGAQREVAKFRAEAEAALRKNDFPFKNGGKYQFSRDYKQRSLIGRYVSVIWHDETFTGGAHPNTSINTILWDRTTRKQISIRGFFKETADNGPTMTTLAKLVRAAVAAEKKKRDLPVGDDPDTDDFLKTITPSLLKLGPVSLAPSTVANKSSGLTFHYSPYMVGPYADGPLTAFLPWTAFKDTLSPEGAALFGGDRPENDSDGLD